MLPDSREVRDYLLNIRLKLRKRDLLWILVLILPGGFLFMAIVLGFKNRVKLWEHLKSFREK